MTEQTALPPVVDQDTWRAALAMAAIVSGCYVVSSNRAGAQGDQVFGGKGFAFAPGGELIAETSAENPVATISIDLGRVAAAKAGWPCNICDLNGPLSSRRPL